MKNRDAKTSSFPKLTLANEQGIIYNHIRNSQRVFVHPMVVTGNL